MAFLVCAKGDIQPGVQRFHRIHIEISNICNFQCSFCPVVERDKHIMHPQNFSKVLAQAKPLSEQVALHLMGEPLAHPHFDEILKICETQEVKINLTSNGSLLNRYESLLLNSPALQQINFSLQSFPDNFPDKSFEPYLASLLSFVDRALLKSPDLYINFRLWNVGVDSPFNESVFLALEKHFNTSINRQIEVGKIKSKRIIQRLYLHFDSRFVWPSADLPFLGTQGKCHALTQHIGIHADGTVVPCCLDKEAQIPLGNCLQDKLTDILKSSRAESMRLGFERNQLIESLCQRCDYIKRFNRNLHKAPLRSANLNSPEIAE